jgi:asparagine synthase (glutamine-hydrolysing)
VTPAADDLLATVGAIVWHHDAPTPIRGRFPQWHVLRAASEHVTVVLGGQGADELLGGYDRFILPYALDRLDPRLGGRSGRGGLLAELVQLGRVAKGIHRVLPRLMLAALRVRFGLRGPYAAIPGAMLPGAAVPRHRMVGSWRSPGGERPYRSRLNNALWAELRHAGLPEVLHSEDALSMAFSLESRLPFLDHRLVEFCFSLAYAEKIGSGWTKLLLRQATAGMLPESVRWRRHKLGFPGDYRSWLGSPSGMEAVRAVLLDRLSLERGWVDRNWLQDRLGGSPSRASGWIKRHLAQAWGLLTQEIWSRQFLDGTGLKAAAIPARRRVAAPDGAAAASP